ncbi:MAG TPA: hypothetical protein EYG03_03335 [Planctomycetes bacterium]|nr:hypothetical protein [Planctomycetota bacterium]
MSNPSTARLNTFVDWVDKVTKPVVVISVILYLVEIELSLRNHWGNSHESPSFFLWSERLIAGLFTFEIFIRWRRQRLRSDEMTTRYPFSIWGAIDLLCIAAFLFRRRLSG